MKLVGKPFKLGQVYADYIVPQGYDAQEFKELGVRRMCKLIRVLGHSVNGETQPNENWDKLCDSLKQYLRAGVLENRKVCQKMSTR